MALWNSALESEREEPATRPWSVLSVVEKGPTPVLTTRWNLQAHRGQWDGRGEAQRGSGRVVGLQDASRSRLFGMHWALRRQSSLVDPPHSNCSAPRSSDSMLGVIVLSV